MNQEQTLGPCAFCGKSHTPKIVLASEHWADEYDGYYPHSEGYAVMCDASSPNGPGGCGASGGFKATEADAIAVWNHRAALSATQPAAGADVLLDALRDNSWDLVSFDRPTGGDDADIGWRVIEHHMEAPTYRRIAEVFEDDPSAAIRAAIAASGRKS